MDQQFIQTIDKLVQDCLSAPSLATLSPEQRQVMEKQIRNHLYTQILFVMVDNLTEDQFAQIKDLDPQNPEMEEKIEQFTQTMPFLLEDIEKKLNEEVLKIKQNPQALNQKGE